MIKKIVELIRENRRNQKKIIAYSRELNWADVYQDSIRGKQWLENLPLNVGRWAGNYAFFYIMNRILTDFKPKAILEMGLGESSKFISTFIRNELPETRHIVLEHDVEWEKFYIKNNKLFPQTEVKIASLEIMNVEGYITNVYKEFSNIISFKFDLYIVDGPLGSKHFSRYDLLKIGHGFRKGDEFMILVDDFERNGEKETVGKFLKILESKGIEVYTSVYYSLKNILIISTEKYKHTRSF